MTNSFIANVNAIAGKLDEILKAAEIFDEENIKKIEHLGSVDLTSIIEDLKRGNYLGNRKIDIDLSLNNLSSTELPTYSQADIVLVDGMKIEIPFDNGAGGILELSSHGDIKDYITSNLDYLNYVVNTEVVVSEAFGNTPAMIRFRDADGKSSNIERIELYVYTGSAENTKPSYFWAKTTSALETLANRAGDIIQLGNDIDSIVALSQRIDELIALQDEIVKLIAVHGALSQVVIVANSIENINTAVLNMTTLTTIKDNIADLNSISSNIQAVLDAEANALLASAKATLATNKASEATTQADMAAQKASEATTQAIIATNKANSIINLTTQAVQVTSSTAAFATYNSADGKITFGIPQGAKGDKGEAFVINMTGNLADRVNFDLSAKGFSYLSLDTTPTMIYFKKSDTSGDWTDGIPFGKGDKGEPGDTGVGVANIARTSGNGAAGTTDVYTITLTDSTTYSFNVYHGADSDVSSQDLSDLYTLIMQSVNTNAQNFNEHAQSTSNPHSVTKAQVGLSNVDNTSDENKPVSAAQQAALDQKANITDVNNALGLKANASDVVSKTGTQTVSADIEFTGNIILSGTITDKTDIYSLGKVGEIGFGVATALPTWYSAIGATPLDGHDVKTSPNYGNYMHIASGAILVCIPKHYFKITGNIFEYSDIPQAGFVIDRSFLNGDGIGGTVELPAVFVAKYSLTKNGTMASAQAGLDPLSTNSAHNPISALSGTPSNTYGGLYTAVKTMDSNAFLTPVYHYMMLARMAQAHGKASSNTNICAFIDVNPKMPKGNLNNALSDVNDTSVTFTSSGYSNCALTGSGVPFAKTTHNGQACGVADLNGNMWEVASAFIRTNANGFMVLKDTVDIRTITDDGTGATGAYNPALYDVIDISATVASQNAWTYFGNGANSVFGLSTDTTSATYKQTAIGIPLATGVSAAGTTEFGNDGLYRASVDQLAVLLGGDWTYTSYAGVFCMILNGARTHSHNLVGGRASFLVQ
jgi:hypothetical protein